MLRLVSCFSLLLLLHQTGVAQDAYVEGEVLVTFRQNLNKTRADKALGRRTLGMARFFDRISQHSGRVSGLIQEKRKTTAQLIEDLRADPDVETVEPNYIRHTSAFTANDTDFPKLWGLQNTGQPVNGVTGTSGVDTRFLKAWQLARRNPVGEVVVGVIDTGLDTGHPEIWPNLWTNPGEIPNNGIDDDANGYIDDVRGYDFAGASASMMDSGSHGTHVAGTIAAVGRNNAGVIGVNFRAKLLPLKVSTNGTSINTSAAVAAYNYALGLRQRGVNIVAINSSYGGGPASTTEEAAIAALRDAGVIVCAAAGNNNGINNDITPYYPASYTTSNIISVAAISQTNTLASFSNYGATTVDIAAPGVGIYSTKPRSLVTPAASVMVNNVNYPTQEISFSGSTPAQGITGTLYNCGIGNAGEFPTGVSGNIALIQRGTTTFSQKVTNAMNAGAAAVIIYDNTTNSLSAGPWTLNDSRLWIPALQVTQASGTALLTLTSPNATVIHTRDLTQIYQFLQGTSMATPHVAGAVAFVAMNFPNDTMTQRISRILNNKTLVSALTGKVVTGGRLDLLKIIDTDADGLPDWWEMENFASLAQAPSTDPDNDGFTNLQEFYCGTHPASAASRLAISSTTVTGATVQGMGSIPPTDFSITFPTVLDTVYQVQRSGNLSTWSAFGSPVIGTGQPVQITDPAALSGAQRRFYRIALPEQ